MRKLFLLSAVLAASLAVTGCSESKNEVEGDYTGLLSRFDQKGEAYVSLQINTPSVNAAASATRADDVGNDNYKDATEDENAVSNALLFLFVGDGTGDNTKLQGVYNMQVGAQGSGSGNVQSTCTAIINSDGLNDNSNLYAFVGVNHEAVFTDLDESKHEVKLKGDNGNTVINKNTTWSAFQKLEAQASSIGEITYSNTNQGFEGKKMYMSNAPLSNTANPNSDEAAGSNFAPAISTLSQVTISKIKQTAAEAKSDPAAEVYVERSAVKITVNLPVDDTPIEDDTDIKFKNALWAINNTEKTYYSVRNVDDSWWKLYSSVYKINNSKYFYRFLSKDDVEGESGLYRTYWAVDPHYAYEDNATAETNLQYTTTIGDNWIYSGKDGFCTENTMNILGMTKDKTTCLTIRLQFNSGTSFWTSEDGGNEILDQNGVKDKIFTYLKNNKSTDYNNFLALFSGNETNAKADITFTLVTNAAGPAAFTTDGKPKSTNKSSDAAATKFIADFEAAFTAMGFKFYYAGLAYYLLPIRHFGNVETPLTQDTNGAYLALYGDGETANEADYLGRYGLVRNNWYEITISGVRRIGTPIIPTNPPTDPDDDVFSYLSAKIHILKWAKRSYGVKI